LGVNGFCLARIDIEERRIETGRILLEEVRRFNVRGAMMVRIWIVKCIGVESVTGYLL
jgi:hypothetical protein